MFWGVREPKRVQLLTVDRPRVDVEVAGVIKTSKPLMNIQRNSNFEKPLEYIDLVDYDTIVSERIQTNGISIGLL